MKLLHGFEDRAAYQGGFVSIGNYDGVHRGHQTMISILVERAHAFQVPAVVLTFDPHPITILRPGEVPPRLSSLTRKAELLQKCGVDCVIAYPTDVELLRLTPEAFFDQIVQKELKARGLVEGPNFFFGHNRAGDIGRLRRLCDQAGLELKIVSPVKSGDRLISSSVIRRLIAEGNIGEAVGLLGHPYRVHGRVTSGAGRGQELGFPTANLADIETLLPPEGVYAGIAYWRRHSYPAAIHWGPNLTFDEIERKLEVHLVDYSGDLCGEELDVDFLKRLRGTLSFGSPDELRHQLQHDIQQTKEITRECDRHGT